MPRMSNGHVNIQVTLLRKFASGNRRQYATYRCPLCLKTKTYSLMRSIYYRIVCNGIDIKITKEHHDYAEDE